jgi:putative ABC transport system substrate-binding protein
VRGDAPVQALLKYFTEVTGADNLAVFFDVSSPEGVLQKDTLIESGQRKGVVVTPIGMGNTKDHINLLQRLPADVDGLFLASSEHAGSRLKEVLALVSSRHLPVITQRAGAAELGAFMVLETSVVEQGEQLAEMAGSLLSGTKVKSLPMYKPRDVAFVINMKVAKEYGINVPLQVLSLASRVVR